MITLALDASLKIITVAILQDGGIRAGLSRMPLSPHSGSLLLLIEEVVRAAGIGLADVTEALFCNGPGGFTSLRVGLATLQGLFFAPATPIRAASSLLFRCLSVDPEGSTPVMALMRAGQGRFFAGWRVQGQFSEGVLTREGVRARVSALGPLPLIVGDGAADFEAVEFPSGSRSTPHDVVQPEAFLALNRLMPAGVGTGKVELHYLQPPVA